MVTPRISVERTHGVHRGWVQFLAAHNCNPSYLGGKDRENHRLRPAQGKSETPFQPVCLV
jgi:hypothetical protein